LLSAPAHQRRHLAPPVVGEISDFVWLAQKAQEPRRRRRCASRVGLLVQAMIASVSTVPDGMTGRMVRSVSAASSCGMESSVSAGRP